jgi:hypothetical protein
MVAAPDLHPTPQPVADLVEDQLRDLLGAAFRPAAPDRAPGRPPLVPALMLWAGLLVCLLRQQCCSQLELWRRLTAGKLWDFPRVAVSDMAVYQRLARTPATQMAAFFATITTALQGRLAAQPPALPYARFATAILALDHTTLDPVFRKMKLLRAQPPGAPALLPGKLACLFDLRRQQWLRAEFVPDAVRNVKQDVDPLLTDVAPGTLLLFDLGYFSFAWFDQLTTAGYHWITRQRAKTSVQLLHEFYAGGNAAATLRDQLVYLGKYRTDRAAQPVRLITITVGERVFTYLTNVLDPRVLPAWEVAALYQHRWNIEQAFNLVKTHLGLAQLWSGRPNTLLHQVYGTLILAQILLGLRGEVAALAGVAPREVSLPLLIRWLPRFAAQGGDPLGRFVAEGARLGFIRPFRGQQYLVPEVAAADYTLPQDWPEARTARHSGRKAGPRPSTTAERERAKTRRAKAREKGAQPRS